MREYTNKLLEMIDDGLISEDYVISACLEYMSESDVEDMMQVNDLLIDEE